MTSTRRIFLNVIASYGRSLVALVLGLYSLRWVLDSLGKSDYGLYTVVGSIIIFISFFNTLLGISIARYYAYSIGKGTRMTQEAACEDLKRWFNTALSLHLVLPLMLLIVGYPLGVYAIRNWINIPGERVVACVWVFRIALVTAFVNMLSIPFISMYTARQWIAQLAFFGVLSGVLNFIFAFSLRYVSMDRLICYSLYMMLVNAGIPLLQIAFAMIQFRECRIEFSFWFEGRRLRSLLSFAGWTTFGFGGYTLGFQGLSLVTNHYCGSAVNASYGVANQLSSQTGALANSLLGAMLPVVTTKEGAGDRAGMVRTAYITGKVGALFLLLFGIPLCLELPEVVRLWLGSTPPEAVVPICRVVLCGVVLDKLILGHQVALNAAGKIAFWQFTHGLILAGMVVLAILFATLFEGGEERPLAAAYGYLCSSFFCMCNMLYFGKRILAMLILPWLRNVALPIFAVAVFTLSIGVLPVLSMQQSLGRVFVTTTLTVMVLLVTAWHWVLSQDEREGIVVKICAVGKRMGIWEKD